MKNYSFTAYSYWHGKRDVATHIKGILQAESEEEARWFIFSKLMDTDDSDYDAYIRETSASIDKSKDLFYQKDTVFYHKVHVQCEDTD